MPKSMKEMMEDLSDPLKMQLQAIYENARISTDMAYRLAIANIPGTLAEKISAAKILQKSISEDLNAAIKLLGGDIVGEPKAALS